MVQLPQELVPGASAITSTPATGLTRLYGPAHPSDTGSPALDVLYTVPAGKAATLQQIIICGANGSAEMSLGINSVLSLKSILREFAVAAGKTEILNVNIPLAAGETINGFESLLNTLTLTLIGTVEDA